MKRIVTLLIIASAIFTINLSATKVVTTYYGSKANDSNNNPCKGETTRICAIIEAVEKYDNKTKRNYVVETVKDSLGNIIMKKEYFGKAEPRITSTTRVK